MASSPVSLLRRLTGDEQRTRIQSIYNPLDSSQQEIRLLEVSWPSVEDRVHCWLRCASLLERPRLQYETISYCWGDSALISSVLLNDQVFYVPRNTELALRDVSLSGRTRTIWIDFLCINQDDLDERSQQVALMGTIYSSSKRNLVHHSGPAFSEKLLDDFNAISNDIRYTVGPIRTFAKFMIPSSLSAYSVSPSLVWGLTRTLDQEALADFFGSPWLNRVWIGQEVVLAPVNYIFDGSSFSVDLDTILEIAVWLYEYHKYHVSSRLDRKRGLKRAASLWKQRLMLRDHSNITITSLLQTTFEQDATDLHDKVFALLGVAENRLATGAARDLLQPDYRKEVTEVFRDATRCSIEEMKSISILSYISHRYEEDTQGREFPSWTVRYDRSIEPALDAWFFRRTHIFMEELEYDRILTIGDPKDADVLGLWGWRVDLVRVLSETFTYEISRTSNPQRLYEFFGPILDRFGGTTNAEASTMRLARTLMADADLRSKKSKLSDWESLIPLVKDMQDNKLPAFVENLTEETEASAVSKTHFLEAVVNACRNRRLTETQNGSLGLVPRLSRDGDVVAVVKHGDHPIVLRPREDGMYSFIGCCYIDELRDAEIGNLRSNGTFIWTHFKIR